MISKNEIKKRCPGRASLLQCKRSFFFIITQFFELRCDNVQMKFKILFVLAYKCGKNDSGEKTDDSGHYYKSDDDKAWDFGYNAEFHIFRQNRNKEYKCQ